MRPKVLILGGGFTGLACANELSSRSFDVALVDQKTHFEFLPNIHELLSGVKQPHQLRLELKAAMRSLGHKFAQGKVTAFDPKRRTVTVAGHPQLSADYLVVTLGGVDTDFGVPGVREHAFGFKSVDQCARIGQRFERLKKSGKDFHLAVIGAGLEGIEAAGELLRGPEDGRSRCKLHLIEAQSTVLPERGGAVSKHLQQLFEKESVAVHLGEAVSKITAKTLTLASGSRIRSDLTVWTGGAIPNPLLVEAGLANKNCWVPVESTLLHPDFSDVFVGGDSAAPPEPVSKQAYNALDMGKVIGKNIKRRQARLPALEYRPATKPQLISVGDLDTVLLAERFALASPSLAPGKELIFNTVMTQLDQRSAPLRIGSVLARNQQAASELLWPALRQRDLLKRARQVRLLR
ncbi:MAG: FAD-dependent oxidoreductase [Pseudomonadota bacterium]